MNNNILLLEKTAYSTLYRSRRLMRFKIFAQPAYYNGACKVEVKLCCICLCPQIKLGLVVDLTNTSRFYRHEDVDEHDCKYVKLQCRG